MEELLKVQQCTSCRFKIRGEVKSAYKSKAYQATAYPGLNSMKWLKVFLLPPEWDAGFSTPPPPHSPSIKFTGTHLMYIWVETGNVRVKCLGQEHNTMSLASARTQTGRSGVERSKYEAIAPLTFLKLEGH